MLTCEEATHLPITPVFMYQCKAKGAEGHHTSSIKPGVITHRLLQIAQEEGDQCKSKIDPRTELTKMKQLAQNWI